MGNFIVYKSSAGSGKTFTLVKEYLKISLKAENPGKYKDILAITFTNKAAGEMKSRIIAALQNLSSTNKKSDILKSILLQELEIFEEELEKRSRNLLSNILHNYADFAVSTIDKFTYKLVRVFARDLHIPINFEVELDHESLLKKVIDLLIDQVGSSKEITELLVDFTKSKTEDEKHWDIEKDIFEFAKDLLGEKGEFYLPELRKLSISDFKECRKKYIGLNKIYLEKLSEIGENAVRLIDENHLESCLKKVIPTYFNYLKTLRLDKIQANKTVKSSFEASLLYPQSLNNEAKAAVDEHCPKLTIFYEKAMELIEEEHPSFLARKAAIKNLYSIALLNEIEKLFEKIKKEESLIHISDFNKRIAEVVNSEPIPFIYERLGEKYKHFMVDEFQDTSVLQYQNILPLLENALAEDNFNMLVGDAKQAIYRWRGGEVEQFSAMPNFVHPLQVDNQFFVERQEALAQHYQELKLIDNYRSSGNLVQFNNSFFSNLKPLLSERIKLIFDGNEQNVKAEKNSGYVSVEFITKEKDYYEIDSLRRVLESIESCREDGFSLKDIAILCRSNKNAIKVANHLIDNSVEVISSESLLLKNSPRVCFLIHVLQHILSPDENIYRKNIIEYLCHHGFIQGNLHSNFQKWLANESTFSDIFKEAGVEFSTQKLSKAPLYEMCEKIVRVFSFDDGYDLYIQFFLESVYNFYIRFGSGLPAFLEWWEEHSDKLSLDVPDNVNAVKIMTIHKSKGLEFPVVIYPFADSSVNSGKDSIWLHVNDRLTPSLPSMIVPCNNEMLESIYMEEVEDELDKKLMDMMNETYVAFTRAVDRLYIFAKELPNKVEAINSLHVLIDKGLQNLPNYNYSERKYEMGAPSAPSKKAEKISKTHNTIPDFISTDWEDKLIISHEAPADWSSSDNSGARQYGNLIHKLLAEINVKEDIQKVVKEFNIGGWISEEEMPAINLELEELLNHHQIKSFFEKGLLVKKEEAILTPEGKSYRPDRVIYKDDGIHVVDFKSGARETAHEQQILNYRNLIQSIENKETEAHLIYLNEREVVSVN